MRKVTLFMEYKVKTLGTLYAASMKVDLDEINQNHSRTSSRLVIRHPSAVIIIPFINDEEVLVVHQFRYAVNQETIEFPAGKMNPGENPLRTAHRELAEETGYKAAYMEKRSFFAPAVGYSDEIIHLFEARELSDSDTPYDDREIARVRPIKLKDLKKMVVAGKIVDGSTIAALAAYEWMKES